MIDKINQFLEDYIWILLVVLVYLIYKLYQISQKQRAIKKKQKEKPIMKEEPKNPFDSIYLEPGFKPANLVEGNKGRHLQKIRDLIATDLKEKKEMYMKAKEKYKEIMMLEESLRNNIEVREQELRMYDERIKNVQ